MMLNLTVLMTLAFGQVFQDARVYPSKGFLKPPTTIQISSETVVSGVDVYNDSLKQVLEKLGKPSRTEISQPLSELGRTVVIGTYEWEGRAAWLKLTTLQADAVEPIITSVEVWGSRPDGEVGTTGRGFKLGDSVADARRLYGLRLYFGVTVSENSTCRPIRDLDPGPMSSFSPMLSLEFDREQRVHHMKFVLNNHCPTY
jgi:hypothetical protein